MKEDIERILVAVDGSEQSDKAIQMASMIAKRMGSEITLIHVLENQRIP